MSGGVVGCVTGQVGWHVGHSMILQIVCSKGYPTSHFATSIFIASACCFASSIILSAVCFAVEMNP